MALEDVVEVEVALGGAHARLKTMRPRRPPGRSGGPGPWLGAAAALVLLGTLAAPTWSARTLADGIPRWSDFGFTQAGTSVSWDAIPDLPEPVSSYLVSTLLSDQAATWTCAPDDVDRRAIVCSSERTVRTIRMAWTPLTPAPEPR